MPPASPYIALAVLDASTGFLQTYAVYPSADAPNITQSATTGAILTVIAAPVVDDGSFYVVSGGERYYFDSSVVVDGVTFMYTEALPVSSGGHSLTIHYRDVVWQLPYSIDS